MSTPMIDRAMSQVRTKYAGAYNVPEHMMFGFSSKEEYENHSAESGPGEIMIEISQESANKASRMMLIHSIITGLENLMEDAADPQVVQAAIDAVRRIK